MRRDWPAEALSPAGWRARSRLAILIGLFALFWITFVRPPEFRAPLPNGTHPSQNLPPSWEQALAFFLKHRALAGRDYVFTYGPLGYLGCLTYDPDLYWLKYAWEATVDTLLAVVMLMVMRRLPDVPTRALFCGLALLYEIDFVDTRFAFLLLACAALFPQLAKPWAFLAAALSAFAVVALVKFTFLVLATFFVATATAELVATGRRRMALATAGLFVALLGSSWLAAGQLRTNVLAYLRGSYEITSGYGAAMCAAGPWPSVPWPGDLPELGLAFSLALSNLGLWIVSDWRAIRRPRRWGLALLCVAGGFVQWKLGFTRRDGHSRLFFSYALLLPFVLLACLPQRRRLGRYRWALVLYTVGASLIGLHSAGHAGLGTDFNMVQTATEAIHRFKDRAAYVLCPWRTRWALQTAWELDRNAPPVLPQTKEAVGSASVDLFSFRQGILFSQGMNWVPRPVFQSYSAYTPYLLGLNAQFFQSERAPRFLIFADPALDARLYPLEDSQALFEILRNYSPVMAERGTILFRRDAERSGTPDPRQVVLERTVPFGESVQVGGLPGECQTLSLRVEYSLWGQLVALVYQPPPVWIELESVGQNPQVRRLIPGMATDDFFINPVIDGPADLFRLYHEPRSARVQAFRILVLGDQQCYKDSIQVTVKALPGPSAHPGAP